MVATRSGGVSDLRRALAAGLGVALVAVAGLMVAEALDVTVLVDPGRSMGDTGPASFLGVALLVADVVLPVPSSLVMVAHGALFGVVGGTLLNLVGRSAGALAGALLGQSVAMRHRRGEGEGGRAARLLERWGLAAVVLTRPVPVLAEATVVAAGALGMSRGAVVAAAALGSAPEAVLYAAAGAAAPSVVATAALLAAAVVLAAGLAFLAGRQPPARRRSGSRIGGRTAVRTTVVPPPSSTAEPG